jgi:hypothetical protein
MGNFAYWIWKDFDSMQRRGVHFCEDPREESYGMAAVFEDSYRNRWVLLQLRVESSRCVFEKLCHKFPSQSRGQKCSSEDARSRSAAVSAVMSRCGIPSISNPTMNLRTVAERSSGG